MRLISLLGASVLTAIVVFAPPMPVAQASVSESFTAPSSLQGLMAKDDEDKDKDKDKDKNKEKKCPTPPCGPKDK